METDAAAAGGRRIAHCAQAQIDGRLRAESKKVAWLEGVF
jgi:hypothetical protein